MASPGDHAEAPRDGSFAHGATTGDHDGRTGGAPVEPTDIEAELVELRYRADGSRFVTPAEHADAYVAVLVRERDEAVAALQTFYNVTSQHNLTDEAVCHICDVRHEAALILARLSTPKEPETSDA